MTRSPGKHITTCAVLTAAGLILGYLETFIVMPFGIPGIRIGLANIVSLVALYLAGPVSACAVAFLRVSLSAILFGSPVSFAYSIAGAAASVTGMYLLLKLGFSIWGVSVSGAILHNTAQICVAFFLVGSRYVFVYLPALWLAGIITGLLVGFLSDKLIRRLKEYKYFEQEDFG